MWRIVFEPSRKCRCHRSAGPWLASREAAEYWLQILKPRYPALRLQSLDEAYPPAAGIVTLAARASGDRQLADD